MTSFSVFEVVIKNLLLVCKLRSSHVTQLMMSLIVVISQWIYDYESRSVTPRLNNFIEITLRHGCSPRNLLYILRTPFLKNTSGRLLLNIIISLLQIKIYLSYYVKQKNIFSQKSDKSKEKYTKQRSS